ISSACRRNVASPRPRKAMCSARRSNGRSCEWSWSWRRTCGGDEGAVGDRTALWRPHHCCNRNPQPAIIPAHSLADRDLDAASIPHQDKLAAKIVEATQVAGKMIDFIWNIGRKLEDDATLIDTNFADDVEAMLGHAIEVEE